MIPCNIPRETYLRGSDQIRDEGVPDFSAQTGHEVIALLGAADATRTTGGNIVKIACILASITRNIVQLVAGILHTLRAQLIGSCQYTGPQWSSNAGATDLDEATQVAIVHGNIGRNHSNIRDTTLGVAVEAILVRGAVLKDARSTTAAVPCSLTDVSAVRFSGEDRSANRRDEWRSGRILRAATAIA